MPETIKVLHLGSPGGLYGAERWILSLVRHLDPARIQSTIGVINDANYSSIPLCAAAREMNVEALVIDAPGKINWSAVTKLRNYLIENEFHIVHTHFYKTDIVGLLAAKGTDCKVVTTPHGWTNNPSLRLRLYEGLSRLVFPFLDAIAPLSEELLSSLRNIPGVRSKLHLIENAVDIEEAESQTVIAEEIESLRKQGKFVVGYIGRLVHGKDLTTLLGAVANSLESQWHTVFVGEGEQADELHATAKSMGLSERVSFFGFRPDRLAFLKGFDVFVLPSRSEGVPRCLMEAMALGVPVIATDIPGCRNLVDGERTGLLFQVGDKDALRKCITKIQHSQELRATLEEHGKAHVRRRFSMARMAGEYEGLYRKTSQVQKQEGHE